MPKPSNKNNEERQKTRSSFRSLSAYAKPHRFTFAAVLFCAILGIAADLFQPYLVKIAIDDNLMIGKNDYRSLLLICLFYAGLSISSLFFSYLQNNLLQFAGQSIVAKIRKDLFEHIFKQSMSYYDRTPSGSLITHVSSDTETLNQFFTQVLLSLVRDGMTLVFIIVLMYHLDPQLTLYSMIVIPIIVLIAVSFRRYMRKTYQLSRTQLSQMVAFAAENLSGMHLIQAFHQEKEQMNRFTERNLGYFRANLREIRTNVLFNRSFDILGNLSVAFITWIGGMAVFDKTIEFGVLYAFITYIRQFFQPINNITQQWNTLQSTTVSVNRIWNIFSIQPEVKDKEGVPPISLNDVKGDIHFNHVHFGYSKDTAVIEDLELHIEPGEMIGIVGTTGAGKSSLISLLCRFYDVQEGSIRMDGTDLRDIPQADLHRMVGLVQQEPYLYAGSILDNVRMFDETITREEVIEACRMVGADNLVSRMKDGYETRISERGSGLSAGERQLISFARIIVFQPKVLILDEATANLDSQTEQLIQSALQVVAEGRTTLVIAHRISTIMHANRIIVMSQGKIVEEGNHAQLLALRGYYEQLFLHSQGNMDAAQTIS
ncbi:ABC transporter ATP-binding protein [Paenibacillus alginolyticus]|uniref:ABC transporter ATP-binding protein/permease n=1 Tax=Paenibacillus alginolyticus TaxID=59839 RepID=A0ABT4GKY7_9BACL|nr:ABC transporter ATP-binding protein [Paenibacillus alginolyticus]MCY9696872.1 ABC transporter ATP-binding protein/permease [Paenibacillus alginolyticus]MEC0147614.1 ABC transporter ATP-binding protein [Paenibacillus alginolyticus]